MDLIGEFATQFTAQLYSEIFPLFNWGIKNWATTLVILLLLLFFRTGQPGRPSKNH